VIKFSTVFLIFLLSLTLCWAGKPLVYNLVSDDRKTPGLRFIDQAKKLALRDDYEVMEIQDSPNYVSPKAILGGLVDLAQGANGEALIGNVIVGYVVAEDGRTRSAVVLSSTDPRLNATALAATESWRFEPATLNGKPIATVAVQDFYFKDGVHPSGFAMSHLVLFQDDATLQARMPKVQDLADYVKELEAQAQHYWRDNSVPESLQVVVAVRPGNKSRVWFISSLQADDGHLEGLRQSLESVAPPAVLDGPIAFSIVADIAGGDGKAVPTGSAPTMPDEWKNTGERLKTTSLDTILNAVWPDAPAT
jgi:TonB family protein